MRNVLHLIDETAPRDMLRQMSLLAIPTDRIVSIGPPPNMPWLARPVEHVHCPLGISSLAGLRAADMAADAVVHAWSIPAGRAARVMCKGRKFVLSLPHMPPESSFKSVVELLHGNACILTLPTEISCRTYTLAQAPPAGVRQLSPPAEPIIDVDNRRSRARQTLGLADTDVLLLALGDMVRDGGHKYASWVHAILRQLRPDIRLLMPGRGPNESHVKFFAGTTGYDKEVFLTEDRLAMADCLAAANIGLFLPELDCGVWSLAAGMAAGLPLCASATPDISECVGQTAMLVPPKEPRLSSAAIQKLIDQPYLAAGLGEKAAKLAGEKFSVHAARNTLDSIYSSCEKA